MPDEARGGWPGRVAVAVVRSDPPQVLLAADEEVLSRLVALKVVARTPAAELDDHSLHRIRTALLEERWGDAVAAWIEATGEIVDGYPDEEVWSPERLDSDAASFEVRMAPIFEEQRDR